MPAIFSCHFNFFQRTNTSFFTTKSLCLQRLKCEDTFSLCSGTKSHFLHFRLINLLTSHLRSQTIIQMKRQSRCWASVLTFNASTCWVLTQSLFSFNVIISKAPVFKVWTQLTEVQFPDLITVCIPRHTGRRRRRGRGVFFAWYEHKVMNPTENYTKDKELADFPETSSSGRRSCCRFLIQISRVKQSAGFI